MKEKIKSKCRKLWEKLQRTRIKMLRHYAYRNMSKAQKAEHKAILLEIKLADQRRLLDEISEGLDELKEKNT